MSDLNETRLWKALDSIDARLTVIESSLKEVVRLDERINNVDKSNRAKWVKLDSHELRIRDLELWRSSIGNKTDLDLSISSVKSEMSNLVSRIGLIESLTDVNKGQKDVGKEILKWLLYIVSALLVYKLTKG